MLGGRNGRAGASPTMPFRADGLGILSGGYSASPARIAGLLNPWSAKGRVFRALGASRISRSIFELTGNRVGISTDAPDAPLCSAFGGSDSLPKSGQGFFPTCARPSREQRLQNVTQTFAAWVSTKGHC